MPEKTTTNGRKYDIDGRVLIWHPIDDYGEAGTLDDIHIPLRLKLKVLRSLSERDLDQSAMFEMLETVVPNQAEALDEMDVADFTLMFETWQREYFSLNGANLPESSSSSI